MKNIWKGSATTNELAARGFAKGIANTQSQAKGGDNDIEFIDTEKAEQERL